MGVRVWFACMGLLGAAALNGPAAAAAQSPKRTAVAGGEDSPKPDAGAEPSVEHAYAMHRHELAVLAGTIPGQFYVDSVTVTGHYIWSFSENWGWEAVHVTRSFNRMSHGAQEVRRHLQASRDPRRTRFPKMVWLVGSRLHFKVPYKGIVFSTAARPRVEARLHAGPVLLILKHDEVPVNPAMDVGTGLRLALATTASVFADAGAIIHFPGRRRIDERYTLYLRVGLGYTR